jgi:hypothetical protein
MESGKKRRVVRAAGDALDAVREALAAIPPERAAALPTIPVDRMLGEARALAVSARKHAEDLVGAGLDEALIGDLRVRVQALADAQAALVAIRGLKRSAAELALAREALALRSDMIASGRFALRKDANAQAVLGRIQEGDGLDDLIQDLRALAVFFRQNAPALKRIGAKPDLKRQHAEQTAAELERLLAGRRGGHREAAAFDLRNRAAVYLQEAVSEIRATGVYVFRHEPRIATKFRSAYNARRRARRSAGAPHTTPTRPAG